MNSLSQQILEDVESLPEQFQREALDFVQFLKNKITTKKGSQETIVPNGTEMAKLMEAIAQRGGAFKDIDDPAAWQREIRKDRPLPGRE